jgi:hypothetical protein
MRAPVSRRDLLKGSLAGVLVLGPLLKGALPTSAYSPCDATSAKLKRAACQGTDWVEYWYVYDYYMPDYLCDSYIVVFIDHPNCDEEDEETQSAGNGLLLAAELGYTGTTYGMIRARTDGSSFVGAWEQFQLVHLSPDNPDSDNASSLIYAIQSLANGRFVSAELSYSGAYYGMLRARASTVGGWEQFQLIPLGESWFWLKNLGNGLLVSAELAYTGSDYGMLRARTDPNGFVGGWEQFGIFRP